MAILPRAAVLAGNGLNGFLVYEGINGLAAGGATAAANLYNQDPILKDVPFAVTIGMGGTLLSGEAGLIGTGSLEGMAGAEYVLGFNSAILGVEGTLIDTGMQAREEADLAGTRFLAGPQGFFEGGTLIDRKQKPNCQVSNP